MSHFDLEKQLLIELEVKNILATQFTDVYYSGTSYNFRCHICGDSKKSMSKKRGHIYTSQIPWVYHCYNGDCNAHMTVETWLKSYFPFEYQRVMKEVTKLKMSDKHSENVKSLKEKINKIKIKKLEKKNDEKNDVSFFKSIKGYPKLIEYCKERLIPESVYMKWYYVEDGFYKNRLIIPFYDNNGKIYYYQGRDLRKHSNCKYLSRAGDDLNSIYNFYNIDKDKPVVVLEGPIDSIFIENSIGLTGLKDKSELLANITHKYFLFDNDKSGQEKSRMLLIKRGEYVFNWKLFLKDYPCRKKIKDVNDFIIYNNAGIRKLTFEMLKKYFTNNSHHKLFFAWKA